MIKGFELRNAMISGSNNIINNKKITDDLNIFPVPDGDTGTNMSMTISAASKAISQLSDNCSVAEVSKTAASAMLRGARGNSGVILSLLFRGFSLGLKDKEEADGAMLANALSIGVEAAYGAVMNPTEGTILTVSRCAAELGISASEINSSTLYVLDAICTGAKKALDETPELLPVLKRAGVVDAGGFGLCLILNGMYEYLNSGKIIEIDENVEVNTENEDAFKSAAAEFDGDINFTYCTEFIIGREETCEKDPLELRKFLQTIGDCVVVVDDEEIIKVHVHTENPGTAMQAALDFGQLLTVKVENMREQHKNMNKTPVKEKLEPVEPSQDFGFVAISAGDGIENLFKDLGCTHVVSGGQTMNPSTQDIVEAVLATPAKTVYVLPNNKNIIMAALQAVPIVTDRRVIVIQTKTIPQGLTAMLNFGEEASVEENQMAMAESAELVSTGLVTFAARDSEFGSHKIKEGEILGLVNGKMDYIEKNVSTACIKVVKSLVDKNTSFVTVIYGSDIKKEEAEQLFKKLQSKLNSDIEITLIDGGQPVYYYIISVE